MITRLVAALVTRDLKQRDQIAVLNRVGFSERNCRSSGDKRKHRQGRVGAHSEEEIGTTSNAD